VHVDLLCNGKKAGELNAYDVDPVTLKRSCQRALRSVRKRTGLELIPYVVFRSSVPENLRGVGIGTAMYLAAAEGAARLGGALVQHACFADPEDLDAKGTTSLPASRVWKGVRFRQPTTMAGGTVAYLPEEHWGRAMRSLTFGQMRIGVAVPSPHRPNPPHMNPDPRRLGPALRWTLGTKPAYEIIDRYSQIRGTTWTSGSCAILALALHEWFPGFRYAAVEQDGIVHHVFVRYGKLYFDADGVSTRHQMEQRWRNMEGLPGALVMPLENSGDAVATATAEQEIPIVAEAVTDLLRLLMRELGPPGGWGFALPDDNPAYQLLVAERW
jgi:hypothetical protein